jgi:hypothetical protein
MFPAILAAVVPLIDKLIPDKEAAAKAKLQLLEMEQRGELAELELVKAQIDVNRAEAASSSVFVAGWRPAVGWVCVAAMASNFLAVPLLAWLSPLFHIPPPPRLDVAELFPILMGMLGLGSMRMVEKIKGVAK